MPCFSSPVGAEPADQVPREVQVERRERERPAPTPCAMPRASPARRGRGNTRKMSAQHQRQVERAVLDLDQQAEAGRVDVERRQHDGDRRDEQADRARPACGSSTRGRTRGSAPPAPRRRPSRCVPVERAAVRDSAARVGCASAPSGVARRPVGAGAAQPARPSARGAVAPAREVDRPRARRSARALVGVHAHHDGVEAALHPRRRSGRRGARSVPPASASVGRPGPCCSKRISVSHDARALDPIALVDRRARDRVHVRHAKRRVARRRAPMRASGAPSGGASVTHAACAAVPRTPSPPARDPSRRDRAAGPRVPLPGSGAAYLIRPFSR